MEPTDRQKSRLLLDAALDMAERDADARTRGEYIIHVSITVNGHERFWFHKSVAGDQLELGQFCREMVDPMSVGGTIIIRFDDPTPAARTQGGP